MNGIDIGILIIVIGSGIIGVVRGLTREFLGLIGWVGAALVAFFSLPYFREITRQHIANPVVADGLTVLATFIAFLILFSLISHMLSGYIKDSALGGVDRSLGLFFGVFRGLVIICTIELIMSTFVPRHQHADMIKASRMTPMIYQGSDVLADITPKEVKKFIEGYTKKAKKENAQKTLRERVMGQAVDSVINPQPQNAESFLYQDPVEHQQQPQGKTYLPRDVIQPPAESKLLTPEEQERLKQETAESLAQLKPKSAPTNQEEKEYRQRDRRQMDRLLMMANPDTDPGTQPAQ